jgi:hypothetical protein
MNFNKINSWIWKAVVFLAGASFLIFILAGLISAGVGFVKYKVRHVGGVHVGADNPAEEVAGFKVVTQYDLPLDADGLDYFIIPVTLEKKKLEEERSFTRVQKMSSYDDYGSSGSSYYGRGPYYNLVFIHKKTGEAKSLLESKGFIEGVYFPEKDYRDKTKESPLTFLLYRIAMIDTNQDGVLNGKDALSGYISNADGASLVQITPENTKMEWWRYDSESKTLFVKVVNDSNKDKKFKWDDTEALLAVDMMSPKIGKEVISEDIKSKISKILKS